MPTWNACVAKADVMDWSVTAIARVKSKFPFVSFSKGIDLHYVIMNDFEEEKEYMCLKIAAESTVHTSLLSRSMSSEKKLSEI